MDQIFQEFIQKGLPIELVYIIFRYAFRVQSPILLGDIKHYSQKLSNIQGTYKKIYENDEPEESIGWLENDIMRYANNDRPTNLGMHPKMCEILGRSFLTKNQTINVLFNFLKKTCVNETMLKRHINIFWGLLTPLERDEFIALNDIVYA